MIAWESHPLDDWKSNWDRLPVERRVPPLNDKYVTITADGIEGMTRFWQGGRQPWKTPRAAVVSVCHLLLQKAELWLESVTVSDCLRWSTGGPECQTALWVRDDRGRLPAVHQHEDGSWWWYDQEWVEEFGPFGSRYFAEENCNRYAREVLGV